MPSLESLGLHVSPSTSPDHYPGVTASTSCLVTRSWLYRLEAEQGCEIGAWNVQLDGGPLGAQGRQSLDAVLTSTNVATMSQRHPTLAVGSNAAPAQLESKFGLATGISDIVPLTRVTVKGIGVGHSAHVSKQGYVAYAPVVRDIESELFMLWLDDAQLAHIHVTEPNYMPISLEADDFPAKLESGELVARYQLYRSKWGALSMGSEALPATTQEKIMLALAKVPALMAMVPELNDGYRAAALALAGDEVLRMHVREAMSHEDLVIQDGLQERQTARQLIAAQKEV